MKSLLDPSFRYVKSVDTDLRKTFARIRREQKRSASESSGPMVHAVLRLQRKQHAG